MDDKATESLKVSLGAYHNDVLHEMAEILELKPDRHQVRKNWLVTELSKAIPKLARSQDFIRTLSESERALLALVVGLGGVATLHAVARPLLLAGKVRIEGEFETALQPELRDLVLGLMRKGLLINLASPYGSTSMRTWARYDHLGIAPEVQKVLPLSLLSPPQVTPGAPWLNLEVPPVVHEGSLLQFMRILFFAWAELRRQPARQLKNGGIGKRDLRRLAQTLNFDDQTELEHVERLYEMLVALKLVAGDGAEIAAVDTDAVTLFWNATSVQQLHDLGRAYVRMEGALPGEEWRATLNDYVHGFGYRPMSQIREDVYAAMAQVSAYGWISFHFLMKFLSAGRSGTLLLGNDTVHYLRENLRWYGADYRNDVEASLARLEIHIVHAVLVELTRLGLVNLGYPESDAAAVEALEIVPVAVRVAPVMRTFYEDRMAGDALPNQPWQVILQPDFQLLAMGPVPLRVLSNLGQVARHEKITESVVTFRISRESAYEAFRRGETVESVKGYLEEAAQQALPQNVSRSIEEWGQQYERIVVRRQVRLIQVDAAACLDRLCEDVEVGHLLHRLDDRVAWVHPDDAAKLEARLAEMQVLLAHSHEPDADLPHSLHWRDGQLEPRASLPSLYVTGALNRIAAPHNGLWRVTPQTVQAAAAVGTAPEDIIALLERMTGSVLPGDWEKQIKAWGKHYGDGKSAQVRLLRLNRPDALDELRRADQRLHRWLRPLPGSDDLAVVNESNWQETVELLASWGVDVEDDRWW